MPNPDGTAAKNNDLFLFRDHRLVFHLIGGIEVRDIALKLRGAGVDHFVDRLNSGALTHFIYLKLRPSPLAGELLVGKAHAFGKVQFLHAAGVFLQPQLHLGNVPQFPQKQRVDLRRCGNGFHAGVSPQQFSNGINAVIRADLDIVQ